MNDEQLRDLFREMRDEPLPADSLARVRGRVAERVAQPARRPFWLQWQLLAAGGIAVALLVVLLSKPDPQPQPLVVAKQESRPAPPPPAIVKEAPAPKPKPAQARVRPRPPKQDTLIRLETPDPNVVIFLVADGTGE
jgi:hypothetical protein